MKKTYRDLLGQPRVRQAHEACVREKGVGERYQVTLVVEYGAGGGGNYPEGSLDLLPVVVAPDLKKAFTLGERVKNGL